MFLPYMFLPYMFQQLAIEMFKVKHDLTSEVFESMFLDMNEDVCSHEQ